MSIFPFTDLNFITILQKSMAGDILLNEENLILSRISFLKKKKWIVLELTALWGSIML